jgi:hypothetical protein
MGNGWMAEPVSPEKRKNRLNDRRQQFSQTETREVMMDWLRRFSLPHSQSADRDFNSIRDQTIIPTGILPRLMKTDKPAFH